MTKEDFVELAGILRDRPSGSKILKIQFEFSEDPIVGLYLSSPWIKGEAFTMSETFQETLRQIFLEDLYDGEEDSPQHLSITIRANSDYTVLLVEGRVLGTEDHIFYLWREEDFS